MLITRFEKVNVLLDLLRVKQYIKNVLIFAPCFFGAKLCTIDTFYNLLITFIGFSFITSFIYVLNDIKDKDLDKLHSVKKNRSIASGKISNKLALFISLVLLILGAILTINSIKVVLVYLFLNLLYIYFLKKIAIVDIIVVSLGYVIRLFIGTSVCPEVPLSHWIIIMTFLLALFLVSSKRYDDLLQDDENIRPCLKDYSKSFLVSLMSILVAVILVAYILYTLSPTVLEFFGCTNLYLTSLFVFIGLLRYLQLTIVLKSATSPTTVVYNDNIIKLSILFWILSFVWIIYL